MTQTAQQFLNQNQGKSLLYNTKNPALRGQCVQAVCFYVANNAEPVIWADAYEWYTSGQYPSNYQRIPYRKGFVVQPNDIVVWSPSLPGSDGGGHCSVALHGNDSTFVSVDSNWGGKTVHQVSHTYDYVLGVLRFIPSNAPQYGTNSVPTPAPKPQGVEMIANTIQAEQAYALLRPNGRASHSELKATAGKRTWANFAKDAQREMTARNIAIKTQQTKLADIQKILNAQNATITDLTTQLSSPQTTSQEKQQHLQAALNTITANNANMESLHDQITDLNPKVDGTAYEDNPKTTPVESPSVPASTVIGKILAALMAALGKFKKA